MATIFVSYRRTDSQDVTGRIYDRLVGRYTPKQVFKDVDSIMPIRPDPDFNNDMARLFGGLDHLEKHLGARSGERSGDAKVQPAKPNPQPAMPDPPKARRNRQTSPLLIICVMLGVLAAAGLCWYCFPPGDNKSLPTKKELASGNSDSTTNKKIDPTYENNIGMKFAWIPPGTFMMGSPKHEAERSDNETQHKVTLTKGFYMGVHLVTQEQWQAVMGGNPSYFKGEANLPVDSVSWNDCQGRVATSTYREHRG